MKFQVAFALVVVLVGTVSSQRILGFNLGGLLGGLGGGLGGGAGGGLGSRAGPVVRNLPKPTPPSLDGLGSLPGSLGQTLNKLSSALYVDGEAMISGISTIPQRVAENAANLGRTLQRLSAIVASIASGSMGLSAALSTIQTELSNVLPDVAGLVGNRVPVMTLTPKTLTAMGELMTLFTTAALLLANPLALLTQLPLLSGIASSLW